jgi:serine protein kinase
VAQIVRYHSAALKGEESRQVLYPMGPVGSGKLAGRAPAARARGAAPVYAIDGCPMQEEPLHLLPRYLRREFEKMLGVHIEGDLCPVCRYRLKGSSAQYEEVPIVMRLFEAQSHRHRRRPAVDEQPGHLSLIGSEDISS